MEFVPKKLYYKIREVCEIASVEAHVLRFWESEFPALAPPKSRKGQRTYRPRDIELVLEIRQLLYEDGYTIAGARKRMGMREPAAALKKQAAKKQAQNSVNAWEPVKPARQEPLSLINLIADGNETGCRADFNKDFSEEKTDAAPEFAGSRESSPPVIPGRFDETSGAEKIAIPPLSDVEDNRPASERLKIVQAELENILTLLVRE